MEHTKHFDIQVEERFREEITACSIVSASDEAMALVDYSFLMKAFSDVVCAFPSTIYRETSTRFT